MTRASGTTRGSAVRSPGTSFQSETRAAPSAAGEQRGGEVRAAAAQRGHLAVGRGADEAGHDRDDAAREQRQRACAGRCRSVRAKSGAAWPNAPSVWTRSRASTYFAFVPAASSAAGDQARAQPLAARGEVVGGARGELAQQPQALRQGLELLEHVADVGQHVRAAAARRQERPRHLGVPRPQPGDERRDGARLAGSGLLGHAKQRVGRPRHRGDDHDGGLLGVAADDVDGVADGGGVGQRRTAELVHVRRSAGPWHKSGGYPGSESPLLCAWMFTLLKLIQSIIKTLHSDGHAGAGGRRASRSARRSASRR